MENKKFLEIVGISISPDGTPFKRSDFYYKLEESERVTERIIITVGEVQFMVNKEGKLLSIITPTPIGLKIMENPQLYTEEECRNMVFDYAQFVIQSMEGKVVSKPVGVWFENNKKQ